MTEPGEFCLMVLGNLRDVPLRTLPAGYELRGFRSGDESSWVEIQSAADRFNVINLDLFRSEFDADERLLADRQLFVVDRAKRAVGSVTAWLPEVDVDPEFGRLHWLAVVPPLQHSGLGSALISACLRRMLDLNYRKAYLTTSTIRANAIRLYERFGFRAVPPAEFYRTDLSPENSSSLR